MAVWTSKPHTREVLGAASIWREQCLLGTGSLFGDGPLWTSENFTAFKSAFVDHPIIGPATFVDKLKEQLAPASPDVKRLAAECLWLLYLFVSSDQFGEELKRERVSTFWELGGTPLPQSPLLSDEALSGLARPGTAFNTKVPDELTYLVELLLAWKTLPTDDASELLQGPWRLCSWVSNVAGSDKRAFRHMFLYFAFPEAFERSCSWSHKRRILSTLGDGIPSPDAASGSLCDVDRALLELRKKLEQQYGTEEIDFYVQPLRARWLEKGVTLEEGEHRPNVWVEKTIVKGRADRMEGDNALGRALWSPQRSKSDGDIYANMRRVRAGDIVLHLTDNEAITGVSIADAAVDDTFMGVVGTEWGAQPSYRVQLRDFQRLAPLLSRAVFLESEPFATELRELIASGAKGLFFNSHLALNQGAYLTEPPPALIRTLNSAYRQVSGTDLPFLELEEDGAPDSADQPPRPEIDLDDLFLEPEEVQEILLLWREKKNVVLQGPPGVGKWFAAQRLAYALMGAKAKDRIGFVQFHQSYSYEDFVQGFRPTQTGFELRTGKFVNFCMRALADPDHAYVFIIDEINRGNLSKILGELMLLIEPDKRDTSWEMGLTYSDEPFHVPSNVFLIGLMNTADRSLAVVDYALRRRFAFINLEPKLQSDKFRALLSSKGIGASVIDLVVQRTAELNTMIVEDVANLGPGFAIGHSFFCGGPADGEDGFAWYTRVVRTEIVPLLREYWFDASHKVQEWEDRLLARL